MDYPQLGRRFGVRIFMYLCHHELDRMQKSHVASIVRFIFIAQIIHMTEESFPSHIQKYPYICRIKSSDYESRQKNHP